MFTAKLDIEINGAEVPVSVEFEVEGDVDGNTITIKKITDEAGGEIKDHPDYDLEFICNEYYCNLAWETYMKTGEFI
jgi:hypothetical protein